METPLTFLCYASDNPIYLKRDDCLPYSFGGNKARIARKYFESIDKNNYDSVVTYGGPNSNLCRVVAEMASQRKIKCVTVMHGDGKTNSFNLELVRISGAQTVFCSVSQVSRVIDTELRRLRQEGYNPLFIPGGGQGVPGTRAYLECYDEIYEYERRAGFTFDYLFLPSGTGTTQGGLVCGKLLRGGTCDIVGISIARSAECSRAVILQNVKDFCAAERLSFTEETIQRAVILEDSYTGGGYAQGDYSETVLSVWRKYVVPLDNTYTAKAFFGMTEYLKAHCISGKRVLFLHTGALPLFFDDLRWISR